MLAYRSNTLKTPVLESKKVIFNNYRPNVVTSRIDLMQKFTNI